jgi:hypothetical protein
VSEQSISGPVPGGQAFHLGDRLYPVWLCVETAAVYFTVGGRRIPLDAAKVSELHAVLTGWLNNDERGQVVFKDSPGRLLLSVWGGSGKTYPRVVAHIVNGGLSLEMSRQQGQQVLAELDLWLVAALVDEQFAADLRAAIGLD